MPRRARKRVISAAAPPPPPGHEPALGSSSVVNQEGMDKVRHALADESNEWGPTKAWPASRLVLEMNATDIQLHLHAIFAGIVPPFS